jgi:hypothetical protein
MTDPLTPDQQELWSICYRDGVRPSGDQDQRTAENWAVMTFRGACAFQGICVPCEAAVRAKIEESKNAAGNTFNDPGMERFQAPLTLEPPTLDSILRWLKVSTEPEAVQRGTVAAAARAGKLFPLQRAELRKQGWIV